MCFILLITLDYCIGKYGTCCDILFMLIYDHYLEKEKATHSSILTWKIPWSEEPDRLQSMGLQRVGHE